MAYDWIQRFPVHHPSIRGQYAMAWDGSQIMLFSGSDRTNPLVADTWTWDGIDWTERSPAHSPSARWSAGCAYDSARGEVVIFGGSTDVASEIANDETWVWNGTDWTQKFPANSPSARLFATMAYDEIRGESVLFSGSDGVSLGGLDDTWTWDGTDWTEKFPVTSPTSGDPFGTMAWDEANGLVVGWGLGGLTPTWTWDGTDWADLAPAHQPSSGGNVYELLSGLCDWRVGGKVLQFGGVSHRSGIVVTDGTWTWDGTDWTPETPAHSPLARDDMTLAFDFGRDEAILFGGLGAITTFNLGDTWVYAETGPYTLHLYTSG